MCPLPTVSYTSVRVQLPVGDFKQSNPRAVSIVILELELTSNFLWMCDSIWASLGDQNISGWESKSAT